MISIKYREPIYVGGIFSSSNRSSYGISESPVRLFLPPARSMWIKSSLALARSCGLWLGFVRCLPNVHGSQKICLLVERYIAVSESASCRILS